MKPNIYLYLYLYKYLSFMKTLVNKDHSYHLNIILYKLEYGL